jgi:hypothetical protein
MKYCITALLLVLLLAGCKNDAVPQDTAVTKDTATAIVTKPLKKMEDTFPFSKSEKIEVISYEMRHYWDTIVKPEGKQAIKPLIENGKLLMPAARIAEKKELTDKLKNRLFNLLYDTKKDNGTVADCFNPRHTILFYDKTDKVIAYTEVCLACGSSEQSEGFTYNLLSQQRMRLLGEIFKDAGLNITEESFY